MRFFVSAILISAFMSSTAFAHGGRRLEITVVDGQLVTRGHNTTGDDGGGAVRAYHNALHDHWTNEGGIATADLPGFDVYANQSPAGNPGVLHLEGASLTLTLLDAAKWQASATTAERSFPEFADLAPNELIAASFAGGSVDTDNPGAVTLVTEISAAGALDIDPIFGIADTPADTIHILRWRLSTDAPGVAPSEDIFTLTAPDASAGLGYHHQSLALERFLGTPLVAGDLDRDGVASADDFWVWASSFGATHRFAGSGADANRDTTIDAADYTAFRDRFASSATAVTAVATPEPGGLLLLAIGSGFGMFHRPRRERVGQA